ncbi:hypothetical protein A2954_05085 [Candidatus Roizmanbacteria bacterium RIFCSPLOWO2_01_FULL_37_12]|uniref:Peptidase A2 domain-containing protein n=1 Tax=Candidatus Roizmanbacteria bacterium RIFCSPLOWO2_01_FULL_37_12 TaxID=1802056 RepID=A0A1F7I8T9_9BACT|nr:MAG: hypothetical protein A2768_02180 [Candidatus Roizmanbacteria bacterium RIFCSPHIGHO2_01_FULL_37_16]OGK23728.1 MAG: hypothetical protein A3D76_04130 [Candidatus Roizmanbacteria bacterium RIFCSPHIGHO2_02_FULL_37_9b]OGK39769.1 MAG: hypothetical protein A2954_05085 [Candidatus Roizmanbacteria bacterium RIFCSPLOWO2_01_FULL_37_12]
MVKPTFTFPYQFKFITDGKILNPLLYLPLKIELGWRNSWFLLDSGADTTMLPLSMAKRLGLSYDSNKKGKLLGIGDKSLDGYSGSIIIKIGQKELKVRCDFIDAEDSTLLLGRLDVFDKFNIHFDTTNKKIIFHSV